MAVHEANHTHHIRRVEHDKVRGRQRSGGEIYLVGAAQPVKEQQAGRHAGVDEEAGQRFPHAAGMDGAVRTRVGKAPRAIAHRLDGVAGLCLHLRDDDAIGERAAIRQQVVGQPGVAERLQRRALAHAGHADQHDERARRDGLPAIQRRRAVADIGSQASERREGHKGRRELLMVDC